MQNGLHARNFSFQGQDSIDKLSLGIVVDDICKMRYCSKCSNCLSL